MKRMFSSLVMLMATTCVLSAQLGAGQGPGPRGEMMQQRMEAQRVAFITDKLQLTPDEATKFWPLYNEYRDKQMELRRASMPDQNIMDVSDAEAEKIIQKHFATEESLLRMKREYYDKLKSAIPARKIARLSAVEMEFNRTVLEHIRERQGNRD